MASKNIKITTDEVRLTGTLNIDNIENGVLIETESGEVRLDEHLKSFNGNEIEVVVKRKIEQPIM